MEVDGRRLEFTDLDRALYPETDFTKADALDYYARIAPVLLPHLQGRAMTLKLYPYGVRGPHFYDKHCRGAPPSVETAPMWSDRKGEDIHFCRLEETSSLLWSVDRGKARDAPAAVDRDGLRDADGDGLRPRSGRRRRHPRRSGDRARGRRHAAQGRTRERRHEHGLEGRARVRPAHSSASATAATCSRRS